MESVFGEVLLGKLSSESSKKPPSNLMKRVKMGALKMTLTSEKISYTLMPQTTLDQANVSCAGVRCPYHVTLIGNDLTRVLNGILSVSVTSHLDQHSSVKGGKKP